MYALMDKQVFVRARRADFELVEKAAKAAAQEFEEKAGYPVVVDIDTDGPLDPGRFTLYSSFSNVDSAGGVMILGYGGKIEIDNTLEQRLKLLETVSLPKIRASIFGYVPHLNPSLTNKGISLKEVFRLDIISMVISCCTSLVFVV